jgi:hypothetical protein
MGTKPGLCANQVASLAPQRNHPRSDRISLIAEFRKRVRAAMDIPALESLFPTPWNVGARLVLPNLSPELKYTAIWGPVFSWCVLELLAESIDAEKPERAALDLFDRLRLREPLAHSFLALGLKGEESWRAAARIKVALLVEAGVFAPKPSTMALPEREETVPIDEVAASATATSAALAKAPGEQKQAIPALSPMLWHDADVRWLTGVHEAPGHTDFVKESYEELIWWLQLPGLHKLAGEAVPDRSAIAELSKAIKEALEPATSADYSLDALLESDKPEAEAC